MKTCSRFVLVFMTVFVEFTLLRAVVCMDRNIQIMKRFGLYKHIFIGSLSGNVIERILFDKM